jgi:hypothetical protein
MAIEEMFTSLPTVATAQMTDIICAVQGYVSPSSLGLSVQETLQQVYNLFQSNVILFNAGNPNGAVAGNTFQLCWDTVDLLLWVCTTTGSAAGAVWTKSIQLTAGSGISIAQSGSNITISASVSALAWNLITGSSVTMASNNAYVANNAGLVTLTLPTVSSFGDIIYVTGIGSGSWRIVYGSGQYIQVGHTASTTTTGNVGSSNTFDAIDLVCTVANTSWQAFNGPQGNLTIV